eukprot:477815_1
MHDNNLKPKLNKVPAVIVITFKITTKIILFLDDPDIQCVVPFVLQLSYEIHAITIINRLSPINAIDVKDDNTSLSNGDVTNGNKQKPNTDDELFSNEKLKIVNSG